MTDDKVTITLAAKTTDPNVLRLAAGDVGRMQLGFNGLPKSLPSTLNALADALDQAGDITYEPTREHWTPYEPWMRDVLADDARVSWLDGGSSDAEIREPWLTARCDDGEMATDMCARIHPEDTPERPEPKDDPDEEPPVRRVNVTITDVFAVPDEYGYLRINVGPETAVIDQNARNVTVTDVEPAERHVNVTITDVFAVPDEYGYLRINVGPETAVIDQNARNVTVTDVDTPPADEDPDEALARVLREVMADDWTATDLAHAAREHIAEEKSRMGAALYYGAAERIKRERAEAELADERDRHNATLIERERLLNALADMTRQRDDLSNRLADSESWEPEVERLRAGIAAFATDAASFGDHAPRCSDRNCLHDYSIRNQRRAADLLNPPTEGETDDRR